MAEYIEREAIMKFPMRKDRCDNECVNKYVIFGIELVLGHIENLPAADVAPVVHGYWIEKKSAAGRYFECSNCGAHENKHTAIKGYYCWRCGAKMDGGVENG
jgi:hypothetical protein